MHTTFSEVFEHQQKKTQHDPLAADVQNAPEGTSERFCRLPQLRYLGLSDEHHATAPPRFC